MKEIWKDIKNYEGLYQVSTLGNVRSKYGKNGKILMTNYRVIKNIKGQRGYLKVILKNNPMGENKNIHRLVAESFIPNPKNLPQVNHINGIKTDNRVENLEWVSAKENIHHAVKIGLIKSHKIKMKNPNTGETLIFDTRKDIEKYFNKKICQESITRCCNRIRNTAYGMEWEYV